jgi:hypothetical protein
MTYCKVSTEVRTRSITEQGETTYLLNCAILYINTIVCGCVWHLKVCWVLSMVMNEHCLYLSIVCLLLSDFSFSCPTISDNMRLLFDTDCRHKSKYERYRSTAAGNLCCIIKYIHSKNTVCSKWKIRTYNKKGSVYLT